VTEHYVNSLNNFIVGYYDNDKTWCDSLIEYFNRSNDKDIGRISNGIIDKEVKDSTDLPLPKDKFIEIYNEPLTKVITKYKEKYPACQQTDYWGIVEQTNIQHYSPKQGYFKWHSERTTSKSPDVYRKFAYISYLNDVNDGGETEFLHQRIKIKPEKGLTLIWPADWTFMHRGISSPTQEKYIATGWYSYYDR
jgi:hypothetical protein